MAGAFAHRLLVVGTPASSQSSSDSSPLVLRRPGTWGLSQCSAMRAASASS